jgi:Na+-transporting NADH:ubiquinone oxidoreductase subunit NqrC
MLCLYIEHRSRCVSTVEGVTSLWVGKDMQTTMELVVILVISQMTSPARTDRDLQQYARSCVRPCSVDLSMTSYSKRQDEDMTTRVKSKNGERAECPILQLVASADACLLFFLRLPR